VFFYHGAPVMYFDHGEGPAIVFVHGLGANQTHFEHVAPPLERAGYRVCGLDLPGFGLSGKPHREYSVRFLSEAVGALMRHLQVDRAILCGHSLGGLVCADWALAAPHSVERLLLISSAGLFRLPLPLRLVARTMIRPGMLASALSQRAEWLLDRVFAEPNERTERFKTQSLTRPDPRFVRDLGRVMWALRHDLTSYHLHGHVERLTMPTLVIWGARDRLLPYGPVPGFTRRLPDGELEVIESCGHMAIIEQPDEVVRRVLSFLQRRASPIPSRSIRASSSGSTAG
jgi:pimeloyl-ACP methyl ester carboxylesterase